MTSTMLEDIARGVELLDETVPGWDSRIDVETLNIASPVKCVLGQLFGGYGDGLRALSGPMTRADVVGIRYGFMPRSSVITSVDDGWPAALASWYEEAERLTQEWRTVIQGRQLRRVELLLMQLDDTNEKETI